MTETNLKFQGSLKNMVKHSKNSSFGFDNEHKSICQSSSTQFRPGQLRVR